MLISSCRPFFLVEWVIDSKHTVVPAKALVSLNPAEVEKGEEVAAKLGKNTFQAKVLAKGTCKTMPFNTSVYLCMQSHTSNASCCFAVTSRYSFVCAR